MLASLVLAVVLARVLGPEGFGAYALVLLALQMLSIPLGRGWGTLLMRTTARLEEEEARRHAGEILGLGRFLSLTWAAVVMAVLLGVHFFGGGGPGLTVILLISPLLTVMQNNAFRMAVLRGAQYPVFAQVPELVLRPVIMAAAVLVLALWFELEIDWQMALQVLLATSVITLALGAAVQARVIPFLWAIRVSPMRIISYGWGMSALIIGINGFILLAFEQLDLILLSVFETSADVGIYKSAMQIGGYGGFAYALLAYVAAARLSAMWGLGDKVGIERLARRYARLSLAFTTTFVTALAVLGDMIVRVLFGQEYADAATIALVLSLGHFGSALFGMSSGILLMSNNEGLVLRGTLALLIVKFILGAAAVHWLGTVALATTSAAAIMLLNFYLFLVVRTRLGMNLSVFGMRP
jgi:O-antigen/teichoic acid export membrane protein